MTEVIIIIVVVVAFYFLFRKKKAGINPVIVGQDEEKEDMYVYIDSEETDIYKTDENGLKYKLVEKTREVPRRTYIKALLNGKYWGEIDEYYSNQFANSNFFDFSIYEVSLIQAIYSGSPFALEQDLRMPRERLPKLLHTILEKDGKEYEVNLHEPVFANIKFNRKLHQDEGNEVFGTIDSVVTGYILDFTKETYFERIYITQKKASVPPPVPARELEAIKTFIPTGNIEYNGNYKRIEYFFSDYQRTYWGNWKYIKQPVTNNEGCFSTAIGIVAGIIGIAFLLVMLPQMAIILPFLLILFLLNLIPTKVLSWFFRIIGLLVLLSFITSLFYFFSNTASLTYVPKPVATEKPEEHKQQAEAIIDTIDNRTISDTLIKHFRIWQDYEGNQYEGVIWTKKSDFINAKNYKNNLVFAQSSERVYDEMIYRLKENDKNNLNGVYQLFDSIRQKQKLSSIHFAELIVSFVQDIPYAVVVPKDCNPNSYDDRFIREYLSSNDARCDGFEKFGINSPVEFMSTLNGDCDTRTLFLYTMLSHYGYDVVLLSSEYYNHSIVGINLPMGGIVYQCQSQRYVLWETTAPNIRAGLLPKEISNLKYWRISLKSK